MTTTISLLIGVLSIAPALAAPGPNSLGSNSFGFGDFSPVAPAEADAIAGDSEPTTGLMRLLDSTASSLPLARPLTIEFLSSGPGKTAAFLDAFERKAIATRNEGKSTVALASISARISKVPAVIEQTLATASLPGRMRNDAVSVALLIMQRDPTLETLQRAVKLSEYIDGGDATGVTGLSKRLQVFATSIAMVNIATPRDLGALVNAVVPALRPSVFNGIAENPYSSLAALQLIGLLDHVDGFDGTILNRIERVARRQNVSLSNQHSRPVRSRLHDASPFVRREAAFASGSIDDHAAVEHLVALLEDQDGSVRDAAHDSLCRLTSMTISADPHRWKLWHDGQQKWWQTRGQTAVAAIRSAPLGDLIDLIQEVTTKRLYRSQVAEALIDLAGHNDPRYVELALSALGTLRAPSAISTIQEHVNSSNPNVAKRASAAIRSMKAAGINAPVQIRTVSEAARAGLRARGQDGR